MAIADNPDGDYELIADIDLSGEDWIPVPFRGKLNGNGCTIYNITINELEKEPPIIAHNANNLTYWNTNFAGFFSRLEGAEVSNLNLLGAEVRIDCKDNAFAGILAGYSQNSDIKNCSVSGRVYLKSTRILLGVGGLLGYGNANVTGCKIDSELVFETNWREFPNFCEEYLGGIVANGSGNLKDNHVRVRGFATIHGFAHNGGIAGIYRDHDANRRAKNAYVIENNEIDAEINFFEHTQGRHAFCNLIWGERAGANVTVKDNIELHYVRNEFFNYNVVLSPEKCENPEYKVVIVNPNGDFFGFTEHTCLLCGYSYRSDYFSQADYDAENTVSESDKRSADREVSGIKIDLGFLEKREVKMFLLVNLGFIIIVMLISSSFSRRRRY